MRLLAVLALLLAVPAHAEEDVKARTRVLYLEATRNYDIGEYAAALDGYKQAYKISGDAAFLFNIGQCHRQLGDATAAAAAYRAFLRNRPDAPNHADVERRIVEMEQLTHDGKAPPTRPRPTVTPTVQPVPVAAPPSIVAPPVAARPARRNATGAIAGGVAAAVVVVGGAVVLGVVLTLPTDPTATIGAINGDH